jgi:hypothetical protein
MVSGRVGGGTWAAAMGGARSKYRAQRASAFDGREFASKAERDRYHELLQLKRAGTIEDLKLQPSWTFERDGRPLRVGTRNVRFTADFQYRDVASGRVIVEDVKGMLTRDAQLRIALMLWHHGIEVRLVKARR